MSGFEAASTLVLDRQLRAGTENKLGEGVACGVVVEFEQAIVASSTHDARRRAAEG